MPGWSLLFSNLALDLIIHPDRSREMTPPRWSPLTPLLPALNKVRTSRRCSFDGFATTVSPQKCRISGGRFSWQACSREEFCQAAFFFNDCPANDLPSDQVLTTQLLHVALGLIVSGDRENDHPYELPPVILLTSYYSLRYICNSLMWSLRSLSVSTLFPGFPIRR